MNTNKKLISFICAIAMMFTMLSGLTITANAAGKGYTITNATMSADGKTATFDVNYEGFEGGITNGSFTIVLPTEADNIESVAAAKTDIWGNLMLSPKSSYPTVTASYTAALDGDYNSMASKASDKICTITVVYKNAFPSKTEIVIANDSYIATSPAASDKYTVGADGDHGASAGVIEIVNPNAPTPPPVTTATPGPVATEDPNQPDKPVITDPVTPDKGYVVSVPAVSADGKTITFDVSYTGFEGGITNGSFTIVLPTEADNIDNVAAAKTDIWGNLMLSPKSSYPTVTASYTAALDGDYNSMANKASDKICTVTVTLKNALANDVMLEIANDSYIATSPAAADKYTVGADGDHGLTAAKQVIKAQAGEQKKTYDIAMSKAVGSKVDVSDDTLDENGNSKYWIQAAVKNADGTDAAYGEDKDFVVAIGDKNLTKAQYENIMNGHIGALPAELGIASMKDAVSKLTFKLYSNGSVTAPVIVLADGTILNNEVGAVTAGPAQPTQKPTPTPTAGVKVTADKTEISSDGSTRVNAVVTDAEGATPGSEVKFTVSSGADVLDFDGATEATVALADNKASVRVYAKKVGTATVKAAYTYTDKDGAEQTKEGTVTIRVKNTSISGGSDSDNKKPSSGGSIAGPSDSINNGTNWLGAFTDLDSVEWAKPSILALSLKGIVSGRGDGTFAPNDNITRAEYCQILIGAIEKSAEYADSEFADVPSDAWFYHAVSVASKYGIVSGYGDGNFGPYDLITRQDMALMTYKAAQVMNKNLSAVRTMSFTDAGAISAYAAEAVQTLADASIINGVSDTEFAPQANATRAQAAKILYDTFVKVN